MSKSASARKLPASSRAAAKNFRKAPPSAQRKERVLIEFPAALLQRADEAARGLEMNRSGLIRNAVERLLDEMESRRFEQELARAYAANSEMNRDLAKEFEAVDREGFQ
jgi:metal-responsive CopG/Arc/MetJ family transcriptional regulator